MVTEITNNLSPLFYIAIITIIIVITLIIFFIKKLNYNFKQVLKSIWISLLITIGIQILVLLIGAFILPEAICDAKNSTVRCPTNADIFLSYLPYTMPVILLFIILIYYTTKFIRKK